MPKKLKIQLCTHVRTYAQKYESPSLWDLPKLWQIRGLYACTLYAQEKLCPKNWKFNFVRMYTRMHKNLRAHLFEISWSFDKLGVCMHVRCTHKKSYDPKFESFDGMLRLLHMCKSLWSVLPWTLHWMKMSSKYALYTEHNIEKKVTPIFLRSCDYDNQAEKSFLGPLSKLVEKI